ncbi:hypothetical protein HT576_05555 [Haloterrigena sp. SYSU A121-1]|uniref:Uncharacterized protein n=1 Tax=Haloterrigena gelatinilytica TaxID=2741724 RepID=A0A8J8GJI5_9EURY|nr:hypothetical protein [Haloterrigena gelatinilytica]NUB90498.1 hypothetical protein [Haloterrigena gelatinilytica]
MERRKFLKGASVAATGSVAFSGLATADNGSSDHEDIDVTLRSDGTDSHDSRFVDGVRDGVDDYLEWMNTWCAYVDDYSINDYIDTSGSDVDPVPDSGTSDFSDFDPIREDLSIIDTSPGKINIIVTTNSDRPAGRYDDRHQLYDSGGSVLFVNTNHTGGSIATRYDHGYNFVIHEMIHGQTLHDDEWRLDHQMGDPRNGDPTIMATGYTSYLSDDVPDTACDGTDWGSQLEWYPDPTPLLTQCTAHSILEYHYGGDGDAVNLSSVKNYVDISENENPMES